jgi:hypothetical protein
MPRLTRRSSSSAPISNDQLLECPSVQALALRATRRAGIGKPVVETLVADRRPEHRLGLEQVLPVPLDQLAG